MLDNIIETEHNPIKGIIVLLNVLLETQTLDYSYELYVNALLKLNNSSFYNFNLSIIYVKLSYNEHS